MRYDLIDWFFGLFMGSIVGGIIALIVGFGVDAIQERRAFDRIVACEAVRAVPRRQVWSTKVICVQAIARQDTTTINLKTAP